MTDRPLAYARQSIDEDDLDAVVRTLKSERLTTGPMVAAFEDRLCTATQSPFASAVNSGTAALHAAYHILGLGPGRALVTSPLTFAATANAALYCRADVRFADVETATGLLDPAAVEAAIASNTAAVTAVDYAGQPADYVTLRRICERAGIPLVADACHSLGARDQGRTVGTLADLTCLSFHPVKPITTAEGGAVLCANVQWDAQIRQFRSHGIAPPPTGESNRPRWFQAMEDLGYNYRLNDLQAALGWSQLARLPVFLERRRSIAHRYLRDLGRIAALEMPVVRPGVEPGWHLFSLKVREADRRDAFFDALQESGILTQVHYIPVYWHPYYRELGYRQGMCPRAEDYFARTLSLPLFPALSDTDVERVIDTVHRCAKEVL